MPRAVKRSATGDLQARICAAPPIHKRWPTRSDSPFQTACIEPGTRGNATVLPMECTIWWAAARLWRRPRLPMWIPRWIEHANRCGSLWHHPTGVFELPTPPVGWCQSVPRAVKRSATGDLQARICAAPPIRKRRPTRSDSPFQTACIEPGTRGNATVLPMECTIWWAAARLWRRPRLPMLIPRWIKHANRCGSLWHHPTGASELPTPPVGARSLRTVGSAKARVFLRTGRHRTRRVPLPVN